MTERDSRATSESEDSRSPAEEDTPPGDSSAFRDFRGKLSKVQAKGTLRYDGGADAIPSEAGSCVKFGTSEVMTDTVRKLITFPLDRVVDKCGAHGGAPGTLLSMSEAPEKVDVFVDVFVDEDINRFRDVVLEEVLEPERERLKNQSAELGATIREFSKNEALRLEVERIRAEALERAVRAFEEARAEILTENRELKRIIAKSGDANLMLEAVQLGARMDNPQQE